MLHEINRLPLLCCSNTETVYSDKWHNNYVISLIHPSSICVVLYCHQKRPFNEHPPASWWLFWQGVYSPNQHLAMSQCSLPHDSHSPEGAWAEWAVTLLSWGGPAWPPAPVCPSGPEFVSQTQRLLHPAWWTSCGPCTPSTPNLSPRNAVSKILFTNKLTHRKHKDE